MSEPITVRNLTAQPLTIKLVERYEAPKPQQLPPADGERKSRFNVSGLTKNFSNLTTNFVSNVTGNGAPNDSQLGEKAESWVQQEVDVRMEPFTTHKTDIKTTERGPGDILRLTLQGDGPGKWRINSPTTSLTSQKLTPLVDDPAQEYTAIYNPQTHVLAVVESTDQHNWMKEFQDDTPLSALSIPGTHNSPTCHTALPSVRCQAVPLIDQLRNGVRFFDIRVQPVAPEDAKNDDLNLVHGAFPISLTGPKKFRGLLDHVQGFLRENPSESVIISLKREGTGNATDQQLSCILRDHYAGDLNQWYTEPRVPHLGEVRGKIVLMRRFALDDRIKGEWDGRGWCLDAENWAYNTPDCTYGDVRVQDFCEVLETENIEKKITFCCDHFERAGQVICPVPGVTTDSTNPVPAGPLYMNFLSASNFWKMGCWPDRIAAKLNPAVTSFLCEKHDVGDKGTNGPGEEFPGDGGVGIVVCDWVGKDGDWDLVRTIVSMNSRLLLRQRGRGWR
ncbi:1-phosphatidylinositol phosphodiesterase [Lecanosticta acicola]|uniref:1-phosphatidylinositol phosphodiesterase n=1 Tax=Lecanosticta acicola TaxID=111012 RepID=A0AAI8Z2C8_9PEZI|nr:1-phosphatidylinositol phosphodiesterase [Lecanosticta acicola]